MRKCLLFAWVCLLVAACTSTPQTDDIKLTFDVDSPTAREVVLVYQKTLHEIPLDEQGHAVFTLKNIDAVYGNLFYGQDQQTVYLERGDSARITFNGNDYTGTFKFEGEKAPVVDYLNRVSLLPLPQEVYTLDFAEFLQKVGQKQQEATELLNANNLQDIGKFHKMEQGRIRYGYGSALLTYPVGHLYLANDTTFVPGEDYYNALNEYMVEDEDWISMPEYYNCMIELTHVLDEANRHVQKYYPKSVAEMQYIAKNIKNERVKQFLMHTIACAYVDQYGIKDMTDMANLYNTYVKDSVLRADYQTRYDKWDISSPGRPSPDFQGMDIEGNTHSLDEFKGKYLYIDLWATWCGPCQKELPELKQLAEAFKDKNITFLGLSIDYKKEAWEEKVKGGNLPGTQLHIGPNSSFQRAYNIDGIPRFILLAPDGTIINNNMSRPSAPETADYLLTLEGI